MKSPPLRKRYYGKYRGTVFNNIDPKREGRIQAMIPEVLGPVPSTWAMPCVPVAGVPPSGFYAVPPLQANVWMEFEHGDPNRPIWSGCFWGSPLEVPTPGEPPGKPPVPPNIVLQTVGQNTILMSGDPVNGVVISCGPLPPVPLPTTLMLPGIPSIQISRTGITLWDGVKASIEMKAGSVIVNMGALVIM